MSHLITLEDNREIRMPCPIHGGDNPTGFSWDKKYNRWRCWTNGCHEEYGLDAKAFVDGLLDGNPDPITTDEIMNIILDKHEDENKDYTYRGAESRAGKLEEFHDLHPSERLHSVRTMKWGISKGVLDRYLVGIYPSITPRRIMFPIFSMEGKIVGATGREINYKKETKGKFPKWKHYNFKTHNILYNIHAFVPKKNSAILVEGPADVLKLESANIHHSLAVFGNHMTNEQRIILDKLGIKKIGLCFDNDDPGRKGMARVGNTLVEHGYKVYILSFDNKYNDAASVPLFLLKRKTFYAKGFDPWKNQEKIS